MQYCVVKTLAVIRWRIGAQNSFGRENFGRLSIYTEGDQKKLADKSFGELLMIINHQGFYCQNFKKNFSQDFDCR